MGSTEVEVLATAVPSVEGETAAHPDKNGDPSELGISLGARNLRCAGCDRRQLTGSICTIKEAVRYFLLEDGSPVEKPGEQAD